MEGWSRDRAALSIPIPQQQVKTEHGTAQLHNPYAGLHYARQLGETVDEFLTRLPPATTDATPDLEWIYIYNPHIPRKDNQSPESQLVRGCENEGPLGPQTRLGTFMEGGTARLHLLRDFIEKSNASGRAKTAIGREIDRARGEAVRDILALAHMSHVRCGKWMLFPEPADVTEVWRAVARATADGELGIAAKVAPRAKEGPDKARLICIYTKDFIDKDDLLRVLIRMKDLGLVKPAGRPIYYKCGKCSIQTRTVSCLGSLLMTKTPIRISVLVRGTSGPSKHPW